VLCYRVLTLSSFIWVTSGGWTVGEQMDEAEDSVWCLISSLLMKTSIFLGLSWKPSLGFCVRRAVSEIFRLSACWKLTWVIDESEECSSALGFGPVI